MAGLPVHPELNTADGSSAAGVVLGPPLLMEGLDALPVRLTRNGELVGQGTGAAAMGHPLLALEWLQRALAGTDDGCGRATSSSPEA